MVSVYPNPPPEQNFTNFHGYYMGGDPTRIPGMDGSDSKLLQTTVGNVGLGVDDPNKKVRKPYTITKSRESWSEQEHDKFLEALQLFDRDWKKIEAFVGSKTVIQTRDVWKILSHARYGHFGHCKRVPGGSMRHAQKYFLKVQKTGTSEHVPPPRPKRKAAHPYPQKAPKVVPQATGPLQSSAALLEPGYSVRPDSMSMLSKPAPSVPLSSWTYNVVPTSCFSNASKDDTGLASINNNYSSSSNESTPRVWSCKGMHPEVEAKQCNRTRVMPDFAQVYSFIGSVFDPDASNHLQRLKKMEPIDVETVLMLMKNLAVNLVSPEFEDHRRLLSSSYYT